jgi:hypothetical protein
MSTPEQWELGGEVMDNGTSHGAFIAIYESWTHVLSKLEEIQKFSKNLKKVGVGRTEDGTLIVARLVPALRDYAKVILVVADQLEQKLGGA